MMNHLTEFVGSKPCPHTWETSHTPPFGPIPVQALRIKIWENSNIAPHKTLLPLARHLEVGGVDVPWEAPPALHPWPNGVKNKQRKSKTCFPWDI